MASQPESNLPGPVGGSGEGRDKRRSFLPAPKRPSGIPSPSSSSSCIADSHSLTLKTPPEEQEPEPVVAAQSVVPGAEKLKVNNRILISGVKPGILRYVGTTHIATGYWCGIELFDASGLHDGEVDGKRYFTCKPFRGIFAPVDKVFPDESYQPPSPTNSIVIDEKQADVSGKSPQQHCEEKLSLVEGPVAEKPRAAGGETSKLPSPGSKSQIARFSGIPRIGGGTGQIVKSKSSEAVKENVSKIATLSKKHSPQGTSSCSKLNTTYIVDGKEVVKGVPEDAGTYDPLNETYSLSVGERLQSDSRQYLNITFNKDDPPPSLSSFGTTAATTTSSSNLPDVVSSASPSPPRETAVRGLIPGTASLPRGSQSAQDIISASVTSDISLGLMEPDILVDEINLLEGIIPEKIASSASESDISQSGNSSTLEECSVNEGDITSASLHSADFRKFLLESGVENLPAELSEAAAAEIGKALAAGGKVAAGVKQSLNQTFAAVAREESRQRKDSTSSLTNGPVAGVKADHLLDEGSNGVSPEVSQVLEWDYDHDAFDGKFLEKCHDGMSMSTTSASDSCSDASAAEPGKSLLSASDADNPPNGDGDADSNQFEEAEDGFENIDNIADFPLGMSKDTQHMMTDSGISEKGFLMEPAADSSSSAACNRRSVEFDSNVKVVGISPPQEASGGHGDGELTVSDACLQKDLMDGHKKQERPLSLVSTASADTGYVPDTDSEAGTLTANSPTDWSAEKQLNAANNATASPDPSQRQRNSASLKSKQSLIGRGLPGETLKEVESDSDDAGVTVVERTTQRPSATDDQDKTACIEESEESEEEEEEEDEEDEEDEEETSEEEEEETSSEEEDDDEDEEDEEDDEADDRPEDDRIEADRSMEKTRPSATAMALRPPDGTLNASMSSSAVMGNEMTESAEPPPCLAGSSSSADKEAKTSASGKSSSKGQDQPGSTSGEGTPKDKTKKSGSKKKKSASASVVVDKKVIAEQKKAVKSATSRLAEYINAPLPPAKPKEKNKAESKKKKSNANASGKGKNNSSKKQDVNNVDKIKEGDANANEADAAPKRERRQKPVKPEIPKVKRDTPKSKWGNIMSQIEANKDTVKVKPKSEIKSPLALYLSTPTPPHSNNNSPEKDRESPGNKQKDPPAPPKPKPKLIKHPKPDFSNVKSKLNISAPPPKPAAKPRARSNSPKPGSPRDTGNPKESKSSSVAGKRPSMPSLRAKPLDHLEALDNCSTMSQGTGSCTDVSLLDGADGKKRNSVSCAKPRPKADRAPSVASTKSDISTAQKATKNSTLRNAQKSESHTSGLTYNRANVKSSIPPPTPRRDSNITAKPPLKKPAGGTASPAGSLRSKSSPPKVSPALSGTASARTAFSSNSGPSSPAAAANTSRSRGRLGGLKSGQPPDVVSTSARGSRAEEIARLESLCEARTKELNYTKMQLKAGLQGFDAVTCLLNYCANQLDAFSCPQVTANLAAAEIKLKEQQQEIENLTQQKTQAEQQLQEMVSARDAALQETSKVRQEMAEAEESHRAAQLKLTEEHAAALLTQRTELDSHTQHNVHKLKKQHEQQMEYLHQSHRRQLNETTAEHQMATNQLRVAHLEEIQELRNKHDLQMEELHAQHRNKLEDITHRFESIKLSLSEKVQSLCVECDELRVRAKTSEDALQRDADVKVQLALAPYLNLPKEISSLRTVIDMRTEEIQKLRRQNMDLVKQLEELPIAQEKVVSLQQKVENLQAIINIKTDHEKQLHEKCQVLMRKYDRESRANKRLSMDYEQVMWRMSQSADLGSLESLSSNRQMSHSPSRSTSGSSGGGERDHHHHHGHNSLSPVRRALSNTGQGEGSNGVTMRQRRVSGGDEREEDFDRKIRCRSATFSLDKSKSKNGGNDSNGGDIGRVNGSSSSASSGSPCKKQGVIAGGKEPDYAELIVDAMNNTAGFHDESFTSGHESGGDFSDLHSSLESSIILETPQGVSYNISVGGDGENGMVAYDRQSSGEGSVFADTDTPPVAELPEHEANVCTGDDGVAAARTDVVAPVVNASASD